MKVYIGKYRNRLNCKLHTNYMNKRYSFDWPEEQSWFENLLEKIEDKIQDFYNIFNEAYFDKRLDQRKYIKIDRWDTWSLDITLADIILPCLIQLKEQQHGAPNVDVEDVPESLQPTEFPEGDVDNTYFQRWEWVLDEMIFAFASKNQDWELEYYGDIIFDEDGGIRGGYFEWTDDEGRKAHQERISNGFRLFGKYYEGLWS